MDTPKVAIITRARNRLEYTIRCVNAVRNYSGYDNYKHFVISQDSTDGTVQWLNWILKMKSGWYSKVVPNHPGKNTGDYKGVVHGTNLAKDVDLIMQLDNDIEIKHPNWLSILVQAFQQSECVAMMLRRTGVGYQMQGTQPVNLKIDNVDLEIVRISFPVACFITKRKTIIENSSLSTCRDLRRCGTILKISNITAAHMDGSSEQGDMNSQYVKYKK